MYVHRGPPPNSATVILLTYRPQADEPAPSWLKLQSSSKLSIGGQVQMR